MFPTEADMNKFFDDERLTRYHYLTYAEYVEIFGKAVDTNYLPRINKKIIYGHFDYFNYCYAQTWEYKWYPILAVFSLNLRKKLFTFLEFSSFLLKYLSHILREIIPAILLLFELQFVSALQLWLAP